MAHKREIDLTVAPVDSASLTDRAESMSTVAGGGSVSAVANQGVRLTVDAASGSSALVQTPERLSPGCAHSEQSLLLSGTEEGRRVEWGFIDADVGAFFRFEDGVLRLVVQRNASQEQTSTVSSVIDFTRVHDWEVRVRSRREAEFFVDGESLGTVTATTAVFFELTRMRTGLRLSNPSAAVGSCTLDVHWWSVSVEEVEPRRTKNASKANVLLVKDEGGYLTDLHVNVDALEERYLMVFDKASAPVDTDVPVLRHVVREDVGTVVLPIPAGGLRMAKGVAVAISDALDALSLPSSAEAWFDAGYR